MSSLVAGTRVCAYWSQKYNHLYPGTVSDTEVDPDLDHNYVNVELDDGDNRDIHVDSIRFLPTDYPVVCKYLIFNGQLAIKSKCSDSFSVYDPDPMSCISRRKRRQSCESGTSEGSRATKTPRTSIEDSPYTRTFAAAGDLKMRINVSSTNSKKATTSSSSSKTLPSSKIVRKPAAATASLAQRPSISSVYLKSQSYFNGKIFIPNSDFQTCSEDSEDTKFGIASFLPKDQVWKWSDKGQKRAKGRVYHKAIERKDDKIAIGDSAVFLSTNCPDQPYIGRVESLWETASGSKNVAVRWFYHLAEVECSASDRRKLDNLKVKKVNIL